MATRAAEAATTHAVEPPPQLEDSSSNPDPRLQRQQEQQSPAILMRRQGTAPPGVVGSSSMQPHSPFLNAPASNMDAPTFPSSGAPAAPPRSASPGATRGASAFNPASRKANYASSYSPVFYDNSNAIGARSGPSPNGSNIQQATSSPSMAYSLLSSALPLISSLSPFRSSSSPASQSSSPRVPSSDVLSSPADASLMACFNPASLHPPLPPPRDNLGSRSLQHLRALIHQCLAEVESLPNPPSKSKLISATNRLSNRKNSTISFATDVWATPLYSIALEVAAEVPFVVDTLSPGLRGDSNRNSPDALHHTINVVSSPAGRPENSFYDPAQSDELGGTVKLFGVLEHEATTLECTMRFIIFCVCNLKLEMHMFQDHFVVRPEIPSDSQVDGAVDVVEVASASSSRTPLFGGAPMARRSHTTGSPLLRRGTSETLPLHSSASSLSEVEVADDEFNIVSPRRPMRPTPAPSTKRTSAGMLGRNLANSLWTWMRRSGSSLVGLPGENDSSWDASSQRSGRKSTTPDLDSDAKGAVPLSRPRRFFESLTQQLESTLLSVSPDVIFPPPHLLQRLKFEESMLLSPFDPSASTSSGLGSTASLTDNPKLAVIVGASNRPFPLPPSYTTAYAKAGMKNFITNNNSLMGMIKHQRLTFSYTYFWNSTSGLPCQQSKLLTVEYYSKSGNFQDRTLGQYIIMLCLRSDTPCRDGVCGGRPMGGHVTTYTHHNAKVVVTVKAGLPPKSIAVDSDPYLQLQTIVMWSECKDCGARTPFLPMSDSTWLYSFGKYLEVLIYNPKFFPNATRFGPPRFGQSACEHAGKGSDARRKLRRCFGYRWRVIAIEVEDIKVFELRGPRIQVLPASATVWPSRSSTPTQHLRSSHSSGRLSVNTDWKPLPSLPNALSLSNIGKARPESQSPPPGPIRRTIRPSSPPFVSSLKATFFSSRNATDSLKEVPSGVALTRSPSPTSPMEPERLASLPFPSENTRHHLFQDADLALQQTRRDIQLFYSSVRDHLTPFCGPLQSASPSSSTTTTATTANFTGSDGVSEAVNLVIPRMPDIRDANSALAPASESPRSSNDTAISPSAVALYPALAAAITASWAHPTRKSFFLSSSAPLSPIELDNTVLRLRAQMLTALEQCRVDESGLLLMLDNLSESGSMEKLNDVRRFFAEAVERVGAVCDGWEKDFSIKLDIRRFWECPEYISAKSCFVLPDSFIIVRDDEPTSIIAFTLSSAEYTREVLKLRDLNSNGTSQSGPSKSNHGHSATPSPSPEAIGGDSAAVSSSAGFAAIAIAAASAVSESSRWESMDEYRTKIKVFSHEAVDAPIGGTGGKPHIRYKFAEGKSIFSCTVYFAEQFEQLRRRCDINASFIRSLSRCKQWRASGGKSKAFFFKTHDDRLVIKQLATNWTVAEKDALLKFAPAYFDHISRADKTPTVLAKIFGIYTIKHKNLVTGVNSEMDILVMEHLFWNIQVSRKFDLKGVSDRHANTKKQNLQQQQQAQPQYTGGTSSSAVMSSSPARPSSSSFTSSLRTSQYMPLSDAAIEPLAALSPADPTPNGSGQSSAPVFTPDPYSVLWDGDWIDGRYRSLLPVHAFSKKAILDAVRSDTAFLASSNVMDYSLLVGVDEPSQELIVGIVDFVGPYTWYRKLESKGKTTLRGGREEAVTVIPPDQYADRFVRALDKYFLVVPDKWLKPESQGENATSPEITLPPVL